eukprot:3052027-Prymnesium_polylepis.1
MTHKCLSLSSRRHQTQDQTANLASRHLALLIPGAPAWRRAPAWRVGLPFLPSKISSRRGVYSPDRKRRIMR